MLPTCSTQALGLKAEGYLDALFSQSRAVSPIGRRSTRTARRDVHTPFAQMPPTLSSRTRLVLYVPPSMQASSLKNMRRTTMAVKYTFVLFVRRGLKK